MSFILCNLSLQMDADFQAVTYMGGDSIMRNLEVLCVSFSLSPNLSHTLSLTVYILIVALS